MKSVRLTCASVLCLLSFASDAVDTAQKTPVPDEILSFVGATDTLLAYQKIDLFGTGNIDAIIIVRHQKPAAQGQNPCELVVLQRKSGTLFAMSKGNNVVDCKYNNFAKTIAKNYDDLNEYLKLKPFEVTYENEKARGSDIYSFKFSVDKQAWYTSKVDVSYTQTNNDNDSVEVVREVASYPKDFGWISMSAFNPNDLQDALKKNKTIVK